MLTSCCGAMTFPQGPLDKALHGRLPLSFLSHLPPWCPLVWLWTLRLPSKSLWTQLVRKVTAAAEHRGGVVFYHFEGELTNASSSALIYPPPPVPAPLAVGRLSAEHKLPLNGFTGWCQNKVISEVYERRLWREEADIVWFWMKGTRCKTLLQKQRNEKKRPLK